MDGWKSKCDLEVSFCTAVIVTECGACALLHCCSHIMVCLHWHWSGQGHEGGELIGINECWVLKLYHCPHHQSGCHLNICISLVLVVIACLSLVTFPQVTAPSVPQASLPGSAMLAATLASLLATAAAQLQLVSAVPGRAGNEYS